MLNRPRLAFVDVETDGIGAEARIIEIAVIAYETDNRSTRSFRSFVKGSGKAGPTWVHGIKEQDLTHAPSFGEVWPQISELLEGRIVVAHNETFDRARINFELGRISVQPLGEFLCTMKLAHQLGYAKRKSKGEDGLSAKLDELSQRLGLPTKPSHRALDDTQTCLEVFEFFFDRHRDQVLHELTRISPTSFKQKDSQSSTDSRKPLIVIVDAANINERRLGKVWEFINQDGETTQYWSFEHFTDFRDSLRLALPGAAIICLFDESSQERCSSEDDEANLLYAWTRPPHDKIKIFKVPRKFSADDLIFELAKKLDAYVISGDRFEEQKDSEEWTRQRMVFYARYPKNSQRWTFVNQFDIDSEAKSPLTLAKSVSIFDRRELTENECFELAQYVERYSAKFFSDKKNTQFEKRKPFIRAKIKKNYQTASLSNRIMIGDIQLAEVTDVRQIAKANIRAYNISFLRKYLKNYVTIIGRLGRSGSTIFIEWFNGYRSIKVVPDDESSFIEHINSRQFLEVSGKLRESNEGLVIETARIERIFAFEDLIRKLPDTESRIGALPRIKSSRAAVTAKTVTEQDVQINLQESFVLEEKEFDSQNQVERFAETVLPDRVEKIYVKKRYILGIAVVVLVVSLLFLIGDLSVSLFGLDEALSQNFLGLSSNRLTFR